jgi:hypothetical protein
MSPAGLVAVPGRGFPHHPYEEQSRVYWLPGEVQRRLVAVTLKLGSAVEETGCRGSAADGACGRRRLRPRRVLRADRLATRVTSVVRGGKDLPGRMSGILGDGSRARRRQLTDGGLGCEAGKSYQNRESGMHGVLFLPGGSFGYL